MFRMMATAAVCVMLLWEPAVAESTAQGPAIAEAAAQAPGRGRPPLGIRPPGRRGAADQEPAFARGRADGYARGLADSRSRDRYDPVGHRDYRAADQGYSRGYGSRDVYRDNYRAGFRRGYDEGYRAGGRGGPAGLY
jgi:hypothetical protein